MLTRKLALPRSFAELDALVDKVVKKFALTDRNHANALVSVALTHLPNDQGYTTYKYLGGWVLRNLAYQIADHRGKELRHASQIAALESELNSNPANQKAWDELNKAVDAGSELAKELLARLQPKGEVAAPPGDSSNVVSIKT